MSDRTLRKKTRKNYSKMASGADGDNESEGEREYEFVNNNKPDEGEFSMQHGQIIGEEVLLSSEYSNGANSDSDTSDEEVVEARKQLSAVKNDLKKLSQKTKKTKLQRITREKEELEKSLHKLKENRKSRKQLRARNGNVVTTESLRSMQGVVEEVDRLMDKNLRLDRGVASSSNSNSAESSASSDSSDSSDDTDVE